MLIKYKETGEILTSWKCDEENKIFEIITNEKEKIAEYLPTLALNTEYNPKTLSWLFYIISEMIVRRIVFIRCM